MTPVASWAEIDPYIEAFERARATDPAADPAAFLPAADHPHAPAVLVELLRADLEFGWADGRPRPLAEYLTRFPLLGADAVAQLAFEEYRLRRAAGADPDPAEYASHFGVDTRDWPPRLADAAPGVGDTIPPGYHLTAELGRGEFGRVFLARETGLGGRPVAVKITAEPHGEQLTLARLQHTNIVPVYAAHRVGRFTAVVMPYLGRTTLRDLITSLRSGETGHSGRGLVSTLGGRSRATVSDDAQPLPAPAPAPVPGQSRTALDALERMTFAQAVLWIGAELADGLSHAHERGILHRDIKPANVLLTDDGRPMLLDFNLAGVKPGDVGGTPRYMAPEQLEAARAGRGVATVRTDVYSLGVVLFELLAGRSPFDDPPGRWADCLPEMIAARRRLALGHAKLPPDVTPAVRAILAKCLAPDPAARYARAADLREDLTRQLADRPLRFAPDRSVRERFRKWRRRHPRLASASGVGFVALAALLVVGVLFTLRGRQLVRAEATNALHDFRTEFASAELLLSSPEPNRHDTLEGLTLAAQARERFPAVARSDDPVKAIDALPLPAGPRDRLRAEFAELFLVTARGEHLLAARTTDPAARGERLSAALHWNDLAGRCAEGETARAVKLQRAWVLVLAGSPDEAGRLVVEADGEGPPDSPRTLRAYAARDMDRGEFRKAAELIHRANRADPANPLGWFLLGSCREQLRQFREAVGCYDVAVALRPESHLPYYRRAAALAQLKMHAEAIADYDESLRRHPDYVPAYIDRAHSKAALDDLKGAVADLDRALGFDDAPTRIFFLRAEWRQKLNDPAGAAADRREGLVRTPNDELSWVARGFARLPGDPKGALADFDAALAINPRCAPALENKASVLGEVLGRTEDATRVLDEAVAAHPDYVPARAGRAVLLARLGKRADAHADAKAALAISEEGLVLYQAACVYALTSKAHPEDRVAAFRYLRRALAAGFGQDYLATDTDLDNLRKDPEFGRIVAEAKTGT